MTYTAQDLVAWQEACTKASQQLGARMSTPMVVHWRGGYYVGNMARPFDAYPSIIALKAPHRAAEHVVRELKALQPGTAALHAPDTIDVRTYSLLGLEGNTLRELTQEELAY